MPTAKELEDDWAAQRALHGGIPPGPEHEDRMREDSAYRAQQEGIAGVKMQRIRDRHRVLSRMRCILARRGKSIGVAWYDPKTTREMFKPFPTNQ